MTEWALRAVENDRKHLTRQQFRTLCGQVKSGDPDAALRGLAKIVERRNTYDRNSDNPPVQGG